MCAAAAPVVPAPAVIDEDVKAQVEYMFRIVDTNDDGIISLREFQAVLRCAILVNYLHFLYFVDIWTWSVKASAFTAPLAVALTCVHCSPPWNHARRLAVF